jgi:hypothetical protein
MKAHLEIKATIRRTPGSDNSGDPICLDSLQHTHTHRPGHGYVNHQITGVRAGKRGVMAWPWRGWRGSQTSIRRVPNANWIAVPVPSNRRSDARTAALLQTVKIVQPRHTALAWEGPAHHPRENYWMPRYTLFPEEYGKCTDSGGRTQMGGGIFLLRCRGDKIDSDTMAARVLTRQTERRGVDAHVFGGRVDGDRLK